MLTHSIGWLIRGLYYTKYQIVKFAVTDSVYVVSTPHCEKFAGPTIAFLAVMFESATRIILRRRVFFRPSFVHHKQNNGEENPKIPPPKKSTPKKQFRQKRVNNQN